MIFDILTIFPDLLDSPLNESIIQRAKNQGKVQINITNIRDHATDKHAMTDDRPFGGGEGMVMKAEPLSAALKSVVEQKKSPKIILLTPQGRPYTQTIAKELAEESHLVLVCGRYEGIDERFRSKFVSDEISIGDYILTGGELAAMVLVDSVTRLLPGVLGCSASAEKDTFSRNLLKHPQYTRPRIFEEMEVPDELLSGNHKEIEVYRFLASVKQTLKRRPELIRDEVFSKAEIKLLKKNNLYTAVENIQKDVSGNK